MVMEIVDTFIVNRAEETTYRIDEVVKILGKK